MPTRPFTLKRYSDETGRSLAFWEHNTRMMTKAPGLYCTAIGRGKSDVRVPVHWMASTFLSGVIDDPIKAAVEVPRYGDLRLVSRRRETREIKRDGNALNYYAPSHELIHVEPLDGPMPTYSSTYFQDFVQEIDTIGREWNSEHHKLIHRNYRAEFNLGDHPSIDVSIEYERDGDISRSLHLVYAPAFDQTEISETGAPSPILRRAVITGRHLTMLGALWADTLEYQTASKPSSEPLPADGGQDRVKRSARLQKTKNVRGKTAKAVEAPPPTASNKLGSPANPQQAFQHSCSRNHSLSLLLGASAMAASLDAAAELRKGHPSTVNPELFQYVRSHHAK